MSDRQLSGVNSHKENGSGKSTLIKAILGLKPQISGQIEWGKDIKKNEIGYRYCQLTDAQMTVNG